MEYALIVILLTVIELGYLILAGKLGVVAAPDKRASHSEPIVTGGGLIFLIALWLFWIFYGRAYLWFMLGLTLVSIVSFADDVRGVGIGWRILAQAAAVALMFVNIGAYALWPWWLVITAGIAFVGGLNAFNFMDGINGITCTYAASVLLPLLMLDAVYRFISPMYLFIALLSVVVFGVFNFRSRALCFAGDAGSVSVGFIVLFALMLLIMRTGDFAYLTLVAVYGVDAALTIIHRAILHENILTPHRKHLYQIMANELGIKHTNIALIYAGLQLAVTTGLMCLTRGRYWYMAAVIVVLSVLYYLFMQRYYQLHESGYRAD